MTLSMHYSPHSVRRRGAVTLTDQLSSHSVKRRNVTKRRNESLTRHRDSGVSDELRAHLHVGDGCEGGESTEVYSRP